MLSPEINHLVGQEQQKDRMREIEHHQLLQVVGPQHMASATSRRKAAGWLGTQMVKWGTRLQTL